MVLRQIGWLVSERRGDQVEVVVASGVDLTGRRGR